MERLLHVELAFSSLILSKCKTLPWSYVLMMPYALPRLFSPAVSLAVTLNRSRKVLSSITTHFSLAAARISGIFRSWFTFSPGCIIFQLAVIKIALLFVDLQTLPCCINCILRAACILLPRALLKEWLLELWSNQEHCVCSSFRKWSCWNHHLHPIACSNTSSFNATSFFEQVLQLLDKIGSTLEILQQNLPTTNVNVALLLG